jgi:hypothetical protein
LAGEPSHAMFGKSSRGEPRQSVRTSQRLSSRLRMPFSPSKATKKEREIRKAFKVFDKDGSGSLSVEEMKAVLKRPGGGEPLTDAEILDIIHEFDTDVSRRVPRARILRTACALSVRVRVCGAVVAGRR